MWSKQSKSSSVRKTDLLLNTSSIKSVQCPKSRTETDMLSKKKKKRVAKHKHTLTHCKDLQQTTASK